MNKKMLNSKLLSLMLAGASLPLGALAQGLTVSGHVQEHYGRVGSLCYCICAWVENNDAD